MIDFRLGKNGEFLGTKVNYLAGAGLGVQVSPGIFITKIGGGFSADPFEIVGNAAVSAGPSAGGGCPTVGIDGGVTMHFSPQPVFLQVKGEVVLVCIPLVEFEFYADENGWIKAKADMDLEIPAIVELSALIQGELKIPEKRWQVGARGEASFPYLPLPDLTMKGVVSNLGMAACASITIDLLLDEITLAAGAGVKFLGGIPPISPVQLIAGFRAFLGCDLGAYSPLFAVRVNRQVDAPQVFTLRKGTQSLSFEGVGGAPRVKLISPERQGVRLHGRRRRQADGGRVRHDPRDRGPDGRDPREGRGGQLACRGGSRLSADRPDPEGRHPRPIRRSRPV